MEAIPIYSSNMLRLLRCEKIARERIFMRERLFLLAILFKIRIKCKKMLHKFMRVN